MEHMELLLQDLIFGIRDIIFNEAFNSLQTKNFNFQIDLITVAAPPMLNT